MKSFFLLFFFLVWIPLQEVSSGIILCSRHCEQPENVPKPERWHSWWLGPWQWFNISVKTFKHNESYKLWARLSTADLRWYNLCPHQLLPQYVLEDGKSLLLECCLINITAEGERVCYLVAGKQRECRTPMFKHLVWSNQMYAHLQTLVEEGSSYCSAAHLSWTCEIATASLFCFLPASLHCINLILTFVLFIVLQRTKIEEILWWLHSISRHWEDYFSGF